MALFVDKTIVDISGRRSVRPIPYDAEAWERWVLSLRPVGSALRANYRSHVVENWAEPVPEFKRALEARGYDGSEYPPVALMLDDGR